MPRRHPLARRQSYKSRRTVLRMPLRDGTTNKANHVFRASPLRLQMRRHAGSEGSGRCRDKSAPRMVFSYARTVFCSAVRREPFAPMFLAV